MDGHSNALGSLHGMQSHAASLLAFQQGAQPAIQVKLRSACPQCVLCPQKGAPTWQQRSRLSATSMATTCTARAERQGEHSGWVSKGKGSIPSPCLLAMCCSRLAAF